MTGKNGTQFRKGGTSLLTIRLSPDQCRRLQRMLDDVGVLDNVDAEAIASMSRQIGRQLRQRET